MRAMDWIERGSSKHDFMRVFGIFIGIVAAILGIWLITNKLIHPAEMGYFMGAFLIFIACCLLYAGITGRFKGQMGFDSEPE